VYIKNNKKIFFFLLFSIIFLNTSSCFVFSALGSEINNPIIDSELLGVTFGNFQDNTLNDGSNKLGYSFGGEDLFSFENMGEIGRNLETNEVTYRARAKFGLEMSAWTKADFRDHYPQINLEKQTKVRFLNYHLWGRTLFWIPILIKVHPYYATYNEIDFGNTFNRHNYDGNLPISLYIKDLLRFANNINVAGQTFSVPSLLGQITQVKVVGTRSGEVGTYTDRYTDVAGVKEGKVNFVVVDDAVSSSATKVANWLNEQNLGWQSSNDIGERTIQQSIRNPISKGSILPDSISGDNKWTSNLPIHLQPGVTKSSQYIRVKSASIQYIQAAPTELNILLGPVVQTYQRDVSVHVYNQFLHYDLEISVDFAMTVRYVGKLSTSILEDPNLIISDMLWDTSIMGDSITTIGLTASEDIFSLILNTIINIVIFAVAILVVVKVVIPYFRRKALKR